MSQSYGAYQKTFLQPQSGFTWLAMVFGLMLSFTAMAEPAGRLLFARGDVQVVRAEATAVKVSRGAVIQEGDIIRTGDASSAQLRLSDGAMIALRANTVFQVEKQEYNEASPGQGSQAVQLLRGGMRAITGAIGHEKPSAVSIRTPVATIGIRGTVIDTIYVPPEGLPGLPDVPPGHYTLVLQGRVTLSNNVGELMLAAGEIGYVADENTPPVLRPDLSSLFALYATLQEKVGGSSDGIIGDLDTGSIDNVLSGTAVGDIKVTPGPFAFVNYTEGLTFKQGTFVSTPVKLGADGELLLAENGTGNISYLEFIGAVGGPLGTGTHVAGDSTINWGYYDNSVLNMLDSSGNTIFLSTTNVNYIDADQVLLNLADLPTSGVFSYSYVGGAGTQLLGSSNLAVNFGTGTMSVALSPVGYGDTWVATNQSISHFYGSGVSLTSSSNGDGGIRGRFVGSSADGAISSFELYSDGYIVGTAAFAR